MKYTYLLLLLIALGCAAPQPQNAQQTISDISEPDTKTYELQLVVPELDIPWGMTFLPDGSMLITEKKGRLLHHKDGQTTEVSGLPESLYVRGQGGLLDVLAHPDYAQNGYIYLTMGSSEGGGEGGNTMVVRAKLQDMVLTDMETIYKATPNTKSGNHWGSRLAFDREGYLYFTIGDRFNRDVNPQDLTRDGGKVYRLHDDGRIPQDNPFVGQAGAKTAAYSYGHRNPQGMTRHPKTGAIWTHEHGPKGGDEVNIIQPGNNYGWPVITYGRNYTGTSITDETARPGMEQPLYYWLPSIAPSGMAFGTAKYPEWEDDLLVGSLKFEYLERLDLEDGKVVAREKLFADVGRVRSVETDAEGNLYLGVEGKGIFRVVAVE